MRRRGKNSVTNVRVLDSDAGPDGARVDRILSSIQNSHGMIRMLCNSTFQVLGAGTGFTSNYGFQAAILSDEWLAIAGQFNQYRIIAAKFDVYNLTPTIAAPAVASTWHEDATNVTTPSYLTVVDGPDAKIIPISGDRTTFYWVAHGTDELAFQSTNTSPSTTVDHGGLRLAVANSSSGQTLQVIAKWVVDFRGRA